MNETESLKRLEDVVRHLIGFIYDKATFEEWESKVTHEEQMKKEQEHKEVFKKFLNE